MIDFKYTQNPEAEIPLMFIDKEIGGKDADGNENIQGNDFLKELLYLSDTCGKKNICVWINSPGGIVTEGQSIYTGILNCKANVDTYCYGIAASIAGVIFQAGKKRIMTSFANLMYHPAWSEDGKVDKALEALNKSICVMVAERTGKTEDEVWAIMNEGKKDDKGTWMSADMAKSNGFCDTIDYGVNKNSISARVAIQEYFNKTQEKPKIMNKILNKSLGLNEEASEASAVAVVDALNKSLGDLKKQVEDAKDKLAAAQDELKKFKEDKAKADDEAKAKAEDEAKAKAKADEDAVSAKADDEMKNAVKAGKVKNDATLIASYKTLLIKDFEGTKKIIDALPSNKAGADFGATTTVDIKDNDAEAYARSAGLKPGSGAWYNAIKMFNINNKK